MTPHPEQRNAVAVARVIFDDSSEQGHTAVVKGAAEKVAGRLNGAAQRREAFIECIEMHPGKGGWQEGGAVWLAIGQVRLVRPEHGSGEAPVF